MSGRVLPNDAHKKTRKLLRWRRWVLLVFLLAPRPQFAVMSLFSFFLLALVRSLLFSKSEVKLLLRLSFFSLPSWHLKANSATHTAQFPNIFLEEKREGEKRKLPQCEHASRYLNQRKEAERATHLYFFPGFQVGKKKKKNPRALTRG